MNVAIRFRNVSKTFARHRKGSLLRTHLLNWFGNGVAPFHALKDLSFTLERGESLAIIGVNGAGKSTLLSIAAGIAQPNSGEVMVSGRVAALLDLGAGFHPDLSGIENIVLNSALLGFTRAQTRHLMPAIVDFCELGDFLDEPIRTYSSGMVMRLAFAVAVHVNPDILITDEVLAVGDEAFQEKCFEKIRDMRRQGTTMLCASHSENMLRELCTQAIWLDNGSLIHHGKLEEVLAAYRSAPALSGTS